MSVLVYNLTPTGWCSLIWPTCAVRKIAACPNYFPGITDHVYWVKMQEVRASVGHKCQRQSQVCPLEDFTLIQKHKCWSRLPIKLHLMSIIYNARTPAETPWMGSETPSLQICANTLNLLVGVFAFIFYLCFVTSQIYEMIKKWKRRNFHILY